MPLPDIAGNRELLEYLRGEKTFFCMDDNRELNLILIDYKNPDKNIYEITEEFYFYNGHYANREDLVFLINGIPVLVIECKNSGFMRLKASIEFAQHAVSDENDLKGLYKALQKVRRSFNKTSTVLFREE